MDSFVFRTPSNTAGYMKIDDIAGESQYDPALSLDGVDGTVAIWGTNGTAYEGMHVDPVIPGNTDGLDALTMPRVLGHIDPMDGFEDPLLGFEDPLFG
ncbi:hypothetical protein QO034_12465 [Sedimentitalea sp. JM2-8]|uniref:Uncharacterized protein n=1 Tax=Sedimentitalea xiamensis TaxID=3050037 RepID=A0ABT7FFN6_9RHOB|nr:hypothetical protein [Sedimentitalea xiamensis]MDK3073927.1 hypothetical protein [Sedimentitalea xiamensis]